MTGEIVPVEVSPIVAPVVSPEDMVRQMELFQKLKAKLLDPKTDVCKIKGKPFVKRAGWRKLALAFNISDEIVSTEKEEAEDWFTWRIQVRAWAPNGRSAVGIGACSSREREFAHLDHDVYAIAHTRAKNRAISDLIGSGEVSAEEMRAGNSSEKQGKNADNSRKRKLTESGNDDREEKAPNSLPPGSRAVWNRETKKWEVQL